MTTYKVIGHPIPRVEGPAKVTGSATYAADVRLPGMLWAKLLRSPHPHARILSIDTSKATAMPGVHAVLTGRDVPQVLTGRLIQDMPLLAQDTVRFVGEKVAVVAAETPQIAEAAAELIEVGYEILPAVFDAMEALKPDAPAVHPNHDSYQRGNFRPWPTDFPLPDDGAINRYARLSSGKGDIEAGFARADRVIEHTFNLPMTHQAYLEPHACVVAVDSDGKIQVWAHSKQPHSLRTHLAGLAGVKPDDVRVNVTYIGGDFGGKSSPMDVPLIYFAAKATGRPVKMVMTYAEEFMASNPRHPATITIKTGVMHDGTIVARHARSTLNCGAYAAFKPQGGIMGARAGGCYNIPNTLIEVDMVYTNTVPRGHARAPGAPQGNFAVESHMDMVAKELGIDPFQFRLKNVLHDGDSTPEGRKWQAIKAEETLRAAADAIGWSEPKRSARVGRGLALFDHGTGNGNSTATITLEADGTVIVRSPSFDQGAGIHTIVQQIVAEELAVPPEVIRVITVDTDQSPPDSGVGNSRTTFLAGHAAQLAAIEARKTLLQHAADLLETEIENLQLDEGVVSIADNSARGISVKEVAAHAISSGEQIGGFAEFRSGPTDITSFCTQVAEVEVDPESGQVHVTKFVTVVDSGTILNPVGHRGQIHGGFITGFGYATMEEMPVVGGQVTTLSFADYKIPTLADVPRLTTVYLPQEPSGPAPYQSKSVGETHNPPVAAAIANAVADAVGVRLTSLPITAERVFHQLRNGAAVDAQNPVR